MTEKRDRFDEMADGLVKTYEHNLATGCGGVTAYETDECVGCHQRNVIAAWGRKLVAAETERCADIASSTHFHHDVDRCACWRIRTVILSPQEATAETAKLEVRPWQSVDWRENEHGRHRATIDECKLEVYSTLVNGVRHWGWSVDLDGVSCDGRKLETTLAFAKSAAVAFVERLAK